MAPRVWHDGCVMKTIILLALSFAFLLPVGAVEESDQPIRGVPYLRTSILKMSKGKKTVRIMVWAKNIPLTMRAYKFKGDPKPSVQNVAKGKTLDTQLVGQNSYRVEVIHNGVVIVKHAALSKSGL